MYKPFLGAVSALIFVSTAAWAECGPSDLYCNSWSQAPQTQGASAHIQSPAQGLMMSRVSSLRMPGLAADEYLCPTTCPVNVYNPSGGDVQACYNICKIAADQPAPQPQTQFPPQPVYHPAPYMTPTAQYQYVRVVRPVVYVHYVTQPQQPLCQSRTPCRRSRYGY